MATSPEYAEYVLDQLSHAGVVTSRKMFGGVGVYVDGFFCALISSGNVFYLRTGPNNIDDFKRAGMPQFAPGKGAGMPYYEVPEDVLEDTSVLTEWVARAKIAAISAKKK